MLTLSPSSPTTFLRRPPRTNFLRHGLLCSHQLRSFVKGARDSVKSRSHPDEYSFERLRLDSNVLSALRSAFPSVKHPTPIQHQFIDAILQGKDVLFKDKTGSGKSFALALALMSLRRPLPHKDARTGSQIASLLLVPHRDLAFQFYHWIERVHHHMTRQPSLSSLAQVLVRDSSLPLEERLAPIQNTPPRILISTPQAVQDVLTADAHALPLGHLSTVVVDEADYLIESVPMLPDKYKMKKLQRQIKRHPGPTRVVLNHLYGSATASSTHEAAPKGRDRRAAKGAPQLVMMSATLRNHLRRFLLTDSGWFTKEPGMLVRITGAASAHYPHGAKETASEDRAALAVGGTDITHHVVVVHGNGEALNDADAEESPAEGRESGTVESQSSAAHVELSPPANPEESLPEMEPRVLPLDEAEVSPFNPYAMETIAATFVLNVPSVALLVLPSDAPVQGAVQDLRGLGVNARALDVVKDENGRTHLMRRDFDSTAENPTLLVSTLASTRGLDLPELSHVFVLGVLDGGAVDSYLHVAGRVGRFGRSGRVISILESPHEVEDDGRLRMKDEPRMMRILLKKIGVRPVKLDTLG